MLAGQSESIVDIHVAFIIGEQRSQGAVASSCPAYEHLLSLKAALQ